MQNFTTNDLLLFTFGETNTQLTQEIEQALQTSSRLRLQLENLQNELDDISAIELSPSENAMRRIMETLNESDALNIA